MSYLSESGLKPKVVQIFGELVGSSILNRVDYKKKAFYGFDILVDGVYLNQADVELYLSMYGFNQAPVLFCGTVDQVKKFHDQWLEKEFLFNSTITLDDNHGILLEGNIVNNASEGFVIKPDKPLFETTGSRVILKCKSVKFSETKTVKKKKHLQLSEKDEQVLEQLSSYATESRCYSVVSKLGELAASDFSKVLKLLFLDAKEQYEQDNETELHKECDKVSDVIQMMNKECATELRKIWLNLIDNSKD